MVRLGIAFPQSAIGGAPETLSAFARGAEQLGYDHLAFYDHIVGAERAAWPDLTGPWRAEHEFHDVFVALGYVAAETESLELSVQVLVLPQRQVAAAARQAASVAQLSGNRLRLGVGVGWNPVEYQALGVDFHDRGEILDEQLPLFAQLLDGDVVSQKGRWHSMDHVAINPVPDTRIPMWFGGSVVKAFDRVAKYGDGWITLYDRPGPRVASRLRKLRTRVTDAGRDARSVGLDVWVSMGGSSSSEWRREVEGWLDHDVTHLTLNTAFRALHHQPIQSLSLDEHLEAALTYRDAVADLL